MQRFALILVCLLGMLSSVAWGGTYTLTDGTQITGEPISYNEEGVKLKTGSDTFLERTPWSKFTQESLRQLRADAKTPQDQAILDPMIESLPSEKAKRKTLDVKPIQAPERPGPRDGRLGFFAIFSSPLGLFLLAVVYAANLFAAYEVAIFRRQSFQLVGGIAAIPFFGVASPIIFLAMPGKALPTVEPTPPAAAPVEGGDPLVPPSTAANSSASTPASYVPGAASVYSMNKGGGQPAAVQEVAPEKPALPAPVIFRRGDFSFNRRFFETKLAGFFRLVPSETDKDLVIQIQSSRGDFIGKRITRITPGELYLQVFKNDVTADEMIPFVEVMEVQVRHKDLT